MDSHRERDSGADADRARSAAALRASEARYRAAYEQAAVGIVQATPEGRILHANPGFCQIIGYDPADVPGLTVADITHPDDLDADMAQARRVMAGEIPSYSLEKRYRRKDGTIVWVRLTSSLVRTPGGEPDYAMAIVEDITERKRTEAALAEREEHLRRALMAGQLGTWMWDVRTNQTEWSPRTGAIYGLPPDQSTGPLAAITALVHPDDDATMQAAIASALDAGDDYHLGYRIVRPDGAVRHVEAWGHIRRDADGAPIRVDGVIADVTERARAETALHANEERQTFLLKLSDALRPLSDPVRIEADACRLLGEYLGVDRAYYAEVNEAERYARVNQDYLRGDSPSLVGTFALSEYGWTVPYLQRGETIVVTDTETSDLLSAADRAAMRAVRIQAHISLPVIKSGALVGALCVTEAIPRAWSESDVDLVRETGERIWAAIVRAHAEADLRDSEERYRAVFAGIDEAFALCQIVVDDHGAPIDYLLLDVNPAFEQMTGITPEAARGKTARELVPGIEDWWIETYGKVALQGETYRFENRVAEMDRWFDAYAVPVGARRDGRFVLVFKDVSARKRTEAALRESEERLRALVTTTSYAIYRMNANWSEMRQLDGSGFLTDTAEPTTSWLNRYIHPADQTFVYAVIERAIQARSIFELEHRVRRADGSWGWTLSRAVPLFDDTGAVREWFGAASDVTARKLAEEALRESEARAQALIANLPGGAAFVMGRDLRFRLAEGEALRATGYRPEEFAGKTLAETVGPERAAEQEPFYRRALAGESFTVEHTQDGRAYLTRGVPLRDATGAVDAVLALSFDITERKQAEEALRVSEERFRMIVEQARDYAIFTMDTAGRITGWLPGAEAVFGWSAAEAIGKPGAMTFVPEDRARGVPEEEMVAAHADGFAPNVRWHERRDGTRVFIEGTLRALRDAEGRPAGFLKIGKDVTQRREAEAALRASEERFQQFGESSSDVLWIRDATTLRMEYLSPAFEAIYGANRAAVLGADPGAWAALIHPEDRAHALNAIERVRAGERVMHVFRVVRPVDGQVRWVQNTDFPLRDAVGAVQRVAGLAQDITEQYQAEAALRESEERFRAVADLVPDLLWRNDPTGYTDWYNRRWLEYTGQTLPEATGHGWLDAIHPDDRDSSQREFQRAIDTGTPLRQEHRIRRHDGEYRWFLAEAVPVRDEAGVIARWFGTATDIHQERMTREELAVQVAAATREVQDLSHRLLMVQEEERRALARELHDEVGQSLTGLALTLAMARRATPTEPLERAATIADGLLQQVRDLSLDLRPAVLDDFGLLPALRSLIDRYTARTGVRVTLHHEGMERRFPAPVETAVYRLVQESLTNVARHAGTDTAGVTLVADSALTVQVRDEGRGFALDALHASTGMGGMRERAALAGGVVAIESAPGVGTTITADFPVDASIESAEESSE